MKHYYLFLWAVVLLASCTKTDEVVCPAESEATEAATRSVTVKDDPCRPTIAGAASVGRKSCTTVRAECSVLEAAYLYWRFLPAAFLWRIFLINEPRLFFHSDINGCARL